MMTPTSRAIAAVGATMSNATTYPEFTYSKWRHGGWYVPEVRYPSGACGCVGRNAAGRWVAVSADWLGEFKTRGGAARAEWLYVRKLNERRAVYLDLIKDMFDFEATEKTRWGDTPGCDYYPDPNTDTDKPFLLCESSRYGQTWLTFHKSANAAAERHINQEYAEDWEADLLVDLDCPADEYRIEVRAFATKL